MKHDEEIDKLFREASNVNFSEEIPEEFLVDINQRLDELSQNRKKRPLLLWWFAGCILFAGLAFAGYKSLNVNPSQLADHQKTKESKKKNIKKESVINTNSKKHSSKNSSKIINNQLAISQPQNFVKFSTNQTKLKAYKSISFPTSDKNSKEITLTKSIETIIPSIMEEVTLAFTKESKNSATIDSVFKETDVAKSDSSSKNESEVVVIQPEIKTEKKSKKSIQMELGIFMGVSGINSSFEIPSNVSSSLTTLALDEYRQRREREEVATTSWDLALRYKLIINNFSFQSGLDYFQWGEQIRYEYNSISGINRYSYLNIPLNIGYNFQFNKFGMNPFAGASVGFGFKREGRYLQPDLQIVSQVQAQKFIGNYQIGSEFSYLSESNFKFSVIPIFRSSLNQVVKSDVIQNKYVSFGLQIGFSYAW